MLRVHLLTEPANNQNTVAFLTPIVWTRARLRRTHGIDIEYFHAPTAPRFGECDVVAINSKIWNGPWASRRAEALALIERIRSSGRRVVYFDRTSTPGAITHEILAAVDRYSKTAAYADRATYLRPVYSNRLFAEFYHDRDGIADDTPAQPLVLPNAADLAKVVIAWNTGLATYGPFAPRIASFHRFAPVRAVFLPPQTFPSPRRPRAVAVSCRVGQNYRYATVAHQRREVAKLLSDRAPTDWVGRMAYFRELARSRIVASPFGFSEINYRDFEAFRYGAVLLKPDMSHLETWPDYFRADRTYVAHAWDLSDVTEKVDAILGDPDRALEIATAGQALYRHHAASDAGHAEFAARFAALVSQW